MNPAVCTECQRTVDVNAKFCGGCSAPYKQTVQTKQAPISLKHRLIFAGVVGIVIFFGSRSYFESQPTTANNPHSEANHVSAASSSDASSTPGQYSREEILRYSDFAGKMVTYAGKLADNDTQFGTALKASQKNATMDSEAALLTDFYNNAKLEKKYIEQLQVPAMTNQAAIKEASEAISDLGNFAQAQADMAALMMSRLAGKIDNQGLKAGSQEIDGHKTMSTAKLAIDLLAGYEKYGVKVEDLDTHTYTLKSDAQQ